MKRRQLAVVVLTACGALSCASGRASTRLASDQALQNRVDALERKLDAIEHPPSPPVISGVVLDTDGTPAPGVAIAVAASDRKSVGRTDATGHFEVDAPAAGEAFVWAHKNGKSAQLRGTFVAAAKSITLNLVEPGAIEGTFAGPEASGKTTGWIAPGRVPAVLPGLWGSQATVTGNHFKFASVPAGDVEIHLYVGEGDQGATAHALVHVDPGRTTTVSLDPKPASASVVGVVDGPVNHDSPPYEAFLLMPDGSPEAWYPVNGGTFGFSGRSPGDRVLLFVAKGFKPRRVPVTLEPNKQTDVGDVLLEPTADAPPRARRTHVDAKDEKGGTKPTAYASKPFTESWALWGDDVAEYEASVDSTTKHAGRASGSLRATVPHPSGFGALSQTASARPYLGKRVRLSAFMKAEDVTMAGLWLRVDGPGPPGTSPPLAFDSMLDRPITGTSDWKRYEVVLDVAPAASDLAFGSVLAGSGHLWIDDLSFEIVDAKIPTTGRGSASSDAQTPATNLDFETR